MLAAPKVSDVGSTVMDTSCCSRPQLGTIHITSTMAKTPANPDQFRFMTFPWITKHTSPEVTGETPNLVDSLRKSNRIAPQWCLESEQSNALFRHCHGLESAKFGLGFSPPTGWVRSVRNGE